MPPKQPRATRGASKAGASAHSAGSAGSAGSTPSAPPAPSAPSAPASASNSGPNLAASGSKEQPLFVPSASDFNASEDDDEPVTTTTATATTTTAALPKRKQAASNEPGLSGDGEAIISAAADDQDDEDEDEDEGEDEGGDDDGDDEDEDDEDDDADGDADGDADDDDSDSDSDDSDDSDDDPVVREYDVYVTSELAQNLYLFQYPVRSQDKPYSKAQNSCPVDARMKTKAGLVEVDVPVSTAVNFDEEKGRTWGDALRKSLQAKESGLAGNAIGGARGAVAAGKRRKLKAGDDESEGEEEDVLYMDLAEAIKKGRVLNKQTLGSKIQPDEAKYMAGVFKGDQLHLTPVTATLQLRPQFPHVDAQLAAERAQTKSLREAEEPEKPAQARAVHLSVVAQMSSTMKALRTAEDEEWKKLHWIDQDDDEAWEQYELLCLKEPELADRLKCSTTKAEYMDWLSGAMTRKREGDK